MSYIIKWIVLIVVAVIIFAAAHFSVNVPVAYFEFPEGHCVSVDAPDVTCETLGARYHHRWVDYDKN